MGTSPVPSVVTWRVAASESIGLREWGDEYVVYCGARAATHLLSPFAGTLLTALCESAEALSADALAARLVGGDPEFAEAAGADASEPALAMAVQASLLEFERMGLASQTAT